MERLKDEALQSWLDSLKEGDAVALDVSTAIDHGPIWARRKVLRRSKSQIVLTGPSYQLRPESETKIRAKNGSYVGAYGATSVVHPITEEIRQGWKRVALERKVKQVDWSSLSTEKLESVLAIVEAKEAEVADGG